MSDPIFQLRLRESGHSVVDRVEGTLSDAIRSGVLPAGHRLREIPIATHFDCSTTPVREAIRRLASAGLVKVMPRRGAIVSGVSFDGIEDLYELRLLLEPAMARAAAQRAADRPEEFGRLHDLIDAQTRQLKSGLAPGDRVDAAIHAAISELAGNPVIARHVSHAVQQVEAVQARAESWAPKGLESAVHFHTQLLDAIAGGDPDQAETVMREHIVEAKRGVMDGFEQGSEF